MTYTRRELLVRSGLVAGAGLLLPGARRLLVPQPAAAADGNLQPHSMAMHLHSSFSEGDASMDSHLAEATRHGVDVLWWTDHDWRMMGYGYRQAVHFDSLSEDEAGGGPWTWAPVKTGSLASSAAGIVTTPCSPLDPHPPGALRLTATSSGSLTAGNYLQANTDKARKNARSNFAGQVLEIEVFPEQIGSNGYLELVILSSWHPAQGGRSAGAYSLTYRIGGPGAPGSRVAQGVKGVVTLAAPVGRWTSLRLSLADDVAALWPDMVSRDFSLNTMRLGAVSRRAYATSGVFDYLRFTRDSGAAAQQTQRDLMLRYASRYPNVQQYAGLEVSLYDPHLNWFGGVQTMPDYGSGKAGGRNPAFATRMADQIHSSGGLASYNHMYGTEGPGLTDAQQRALRATVATQLLQENACNADLLEVGYRMRAGVALQYHVAAWDVCSRNGMFLTGTGVSDAHGHGNWAGFGLNWLTWAWAASAVETDLLQALRTGRAYTGDMAMFAGTLDLLVDGCCPMGSVSVSTATSRELLVTATGIPPNGALRVRKGFVDYAGPGTPSPNTVTVATLPAEAFTTGTATVTVANDRPSFVRTEVIDGAGVTVALSNPVWLFTSVPATNVPAARLCACT